MANLPKADELIGSTVTQQQFKTKLKQLVENIDRSYSTLAEANADIANIGVGAKVDTDDSGRYYKATAGATSLTKSPYDPLAQAKVDATTKANAVEDRIHGVIVNDMRVKNVNDPNIICFAHDKNNNALIWIDKLDGKFFAVGLLENIFPRIPQLKTYSDSKVIAGVVDAAGNALWGVDKTTGKFFAAGLETEQPIQLAVKTYKYFSEKPLVSEVNHILAYGQSLSIGTGSTTIISNSQPYHNTTFNSGPRQDFEPTSIIPLVEQYNNPSSDGFATRGETLCSGLANHASNLMIKEGGVNPQNHVIFASTAGHGGYRIEKLNKGTPWYDFFIGHVTKAKALNNGKTYKVQCIPWLQGENNAESDQYQASYASYKAALAQLQVDAQADIKTITGQSGVIPFITYQMSSWVKTWPDIARSHLDLARENDNFMLATPMYHFPYVDGLHLSNVGYKWAGAYFGRAYKQYILEGRKSDFINPLYAYVVGDILTIKFDVPTLPLVLDHSVLASTINSGFKVMSDAVEVGIIGVSASSDTVTIKLSSSPTSTVNVRYALDNLGSGISITNGASGNLRDSTPDTVKILNEEKPLFHVCPHFELTANISKGV